MDSQTGNHQADIKEKIVSAYTEYVLINGHNPSTVFGFAKQLDLNEADFYSHFSSFDSIDEQIWHDAAAKTIQTLKGSEEFKSYNSREKILALFYTLIEVLNAQRSYFVYSLQKEKRMFKDKEGIKKPILDFAKEIVDEGIQSQEFENRKYISEKYHQAIWMNLNFIISFWQTDDSKGFEKTDAAIEKSVSLMIELMGKSALDSFLDLGKFLFQNKFSSSFKL